jgi:hypothetical protein
MTDEPDLTERQEQVLRALMAVKLAADIDPTGNGTGCHTSGVRGPPRHAGATSS